MGLAMHAKFASQSVSKIAPGLNGRVLEAIETRKMIGAAWRHRCTSAKRGSAVVATSSRYMRHRLRGSRRLNLTFSAP
jgi:hypothetical protein